MTVDEKIGISCVEIWDLVSWVQLDEGPVLYSAGRYIYQGPVLLGGACKVVQSDLCWSRYYNCSMYCGDPWARGKGKKKERETGWKTARAPRTLGSGVWTRKATTVVDPQGNMDKEIDRRQTIREEGGFLVGNVAWPSVNERYSCIPGGTWY
jgi:hypothetical protein